MRFSFESLKRGAALLSAMALMSFSVSAPFSGKTCVLAAADGYSEVNNPIIWADVPDPDIIRVGDTYYMVSTTMFFSPGAPVMKSKDLVSWEICSYVYDRMAEGDVQNLSNGRHDYSHGQWAASLRYHKGMYYVFFGSYGTGKSYIYKTDDIENGTWTRSEINGMYHDASILFDDDGRNYLVYGGNGDIKIKELNSGMTGFANGSNERTIIKTGLTGLSGEGAHVQKINGYYYVFLIAWPSGSGRIELCYRSKSLNGQFEGKTILNSGVGTYGSGAAQGGIVDTPDGRWYGMVFQDHGSVGRIPVLVPVTWENDWPVMGIGGKVPVTLEVEGDYKGTFLAASDEFDSEENKLALEWQWNHNPDNKNWSLTDRPGYMRLTNGSLASNILNARNTLTQRTEGPSCTSVIKLDTSGMKPGDYAGLSAFQFNYGNVGAYIDDSGKRKVYMSVNGAYSGNANITDSRDKIVEQKDMPGNEVYLKADFRFGNADASHNISGNIDKVKFSYSFDGEIWNEIGNELGMTYDLKMFTGYRSGIYSYASKQTGGYADIDYFRYSRGEWNTPVAPVITEPDENGYYSHQDFEGTAPEWSGRGSASAEKIRTGGYGGNGSLFVSGRKAVWNGAVTALNKRIYRPGETYCFSADVRYTEGRPSEDFRMTLQYSAGPDDVRYLHIDTQKVIKGEYAHLYNPEFTIPEGAYDMFLILETVEQNVDFYADEVITARAGTTVSGPENKKIVFGDLSYDGRIDISDYCMEKSVILGICTDNSAVQAGDVDQSGENDAADLLFMKKYMNGQINELPVPESE